MKVRQVEAEFFHAHRQTERRTYMMKLIAAFRNFQTRQKT
jgi:hypothetical protein